MRALLVIAFYLLTAALTFGQVRTWQVGEGGLNWDSQGLIEAAVDLDSGFMQPSDFSPEENIVATLSWIDIGGTPDDYVTEGQARVWSNVASKLEDQDLVMVDGDSTSSTSDNFKGVNVNQTGRTFTFDLGASFPANQIVFYPSTVGRQDFIRAYEIRINDGRDFDSNGQPNYRRLRREELNGAPRVQIDFPQQQLRFIELRVLSPNPFELAELEVRGEGFVPRAQYLSNFINFGEPVNFGKLTVVAEQVGNTEEMATVNLEVRNGLDETPLIYYELDPESQSETEVSFAEYSAIELRKRTERYDSENWSPWSNPLEMATDGVFELDLSLLPGLRQFFQFNLSYTGTSANVMRVRRLELTYSPRLAQVGRAEVALWADRNPNDGVASTPTGQRASFIYGVLVELDNLDSGFDGIRIDTPERPVFNGLSLGEPDNVVEPDSIHLEDDGLSVYFPSRRVIGGESAPIWISFETTPLLYSTLFRGWLLDTSGNLPQPLDSGDAGPEIGTNSLLVFGSLGKSLSRFELSSGIITPNGDTINDSVDIFYDLIFLLGEAEVKLVVTDLAGRRVRQLFAGRRAAGTFAATWDGLDGSGNAVAPGHYFCSLSVETQERSFHETKVIGIIY